nr:MAG TPA: hypothetical protein [Caudoviricetes sp.]
MIQYLPRRVKRKNEREVSYGKHSRQTRGKDPRKRRIPERRTGSGG